ncbi:hypothetical protein RRG08_060893, partial [Elysia crispata]
GVKVAESVAHMPSMSDGRGSVILSVLLPPQPAADLSRASLDPEENTATVKQSVAIEPGARGLVGIRRGGERTQGRAGRKRRDPHLIACRAPAMKPLVQRDPHLIACRAPAMKPLVQRDPHLIACRAPAMKPLVHVTRYFSGRRLYRNTVDSTGLTTRYLNPVHARRSSRRVHR